MEVPFFLNKISVTYLDSCVYYSPVCLLKIQYNWLHHVMVQDLYMSLTYHVYLHHKSHCHNIAEILLRVALNTIKQTNLLSNHIIVAIHSNEVEYNINNNTFIKKKGMFNIMH
jgi:hypothetical protein